MPQYCEADTHQRHQRHSSYSNESMNSTQIRRTGSDVSDGSTTSVNYLANRLLQTASFDYNETSNDKENERYAEHQYEKAATSRNNSKNRNTRPVDTDRAHMENDYIRAMSQMNRGDYGPARREKKNQDHQVANKASQTSSNKREKTQQRDVASTEPSRRKTNDRRVSQSTAVTNMSSANSVGTTKPVPIQVKKRSVSKKNPSEETIAIFGSYGVTGRYFLERSIEAGYNIKALILPGMDMEDYDCIKNVKFITGSIEEVDKIREVVENATYVVCLLNDCDDNFQPPTGNNNDSGYSNLNFMHNLVPILQDSVKCRVMLYEASSWSKGNGSTPFLSSVVKKMAVRRDWRNSTREQDKIVKYIIAQTKNAHFNYIVTRPSGNIWDKTSRKKLSASKSIPGPFPITNTDLAEFTLNTLRMEKVYNSCPYVVQDGI